MTYEITLEQRDETPVAVVRARVPHDGIGAFIGGAFGDVLAVLGAEGRAPAGPPFARYRAAPQPGDWEVEAGFPASAPVAASGRVEPETLPGGQVATTVHVGGYDGLAAAYDAVAAWLDAHDLTLTGAPWECYLDGPEVSTPRTVVCFPCAGKG